MRSEEPWGLPGSPWRFAYLLTVGVYLGLLVSLILAHWL